MHRREFLEATVASVVGSTMLVKATPQDIATFAPDVGTSLGMTRVPAGTSAGPAGLVDSLDPGGLLYNAKGRPVAFVTEISISVSPEDATSWYGDRRVYVPGPTWGTLRATLLPPGWTRWADR